MKSKMYDAGVELEFWHRWVRARQRKIDFLRNLDVLCVPGSYDEPKGIFVLEAMANGVAVVQPRRGAFPEILDKTGGGLLVEPDSVESLAQGILALWRGPELLRALGEKGAQGVREHYSAERMAARALEIYPSISTAV